MALFHDRADAGRVLGTALEPWAGDDCVVYGIPRGGIVVADAVARALGLPLDAVVVRKLGSPSNAEFALGAIADGVKVLNPDAVRLSGATPEQLAFTEDMERVELQRRSRRFTALRHDPTGRTAIVVDDGVATGSTASAACHALQTLGARRVVLAVPVAPWQWRPGSEADEYVCPHPQEEFWAVGQFYDDFTQTSDEEVARLLSTPQ